MYKVSLRHLGLACPLPMQVAQPLYPYTPTTLYCSGVDLPLLELSMTRIKDKIRPKDTSNTLLSSSYPPWKHSQSASTSFCSLMLVSYIPGLAWFLTLSMTCYRLERKRSHKQYTVSQIQYHYNAIYSKNINLDLGWGPDITLPNNSPMLYVPENVKIIPSISQPNIPVLVLAFVYRFVPVFYHNAPINVLP